MSRTDSARTAAGNRAIRAVRSGSAFRARTGCAVAGSEIRLRGFNTSTAFLRKKAAPMLRPLLLGHLLIQLSGCDGSPKDIRSTRHEYLSIGQQDGRSHRALPRHAAGLRDARAGRIENLSQR